MPPAQVLLLPFHTNLAPAFSMIKNHQHKLLLPRICLGKALKAGKENMSWKRGYSSHKRSIFKCVLKITSWYSYLYKMGLEGTCSDSAPFLCPTLLSGVISVVESHYFSWSKYSFHILELYHSCWSKYPLHFFLFRLYIGLMLGVCN